MKNQFKKSLSLIMAVLMIMSCWVWVAPDKAKAGTATQYYVKIVSNVTDTGNENSSQLIINYKDTNGKGDSGRKVVDFGQMSWDGNSTIFSGPIDGYPVSFTWTWNLGGGRAEKHENITFYVGGTEDTCTTQLWKDTYNFKNALIGTDYLNLSATLSTSYNPAFKEITDLSTTDVAVSKLKDGADVTSSIKVTGGKDQYGVNWAATIPTLSGVSYKLKYTNASGTETDLTSTYGSISGTSNTATATFKDDVQTLFPNSANAKVYVHATYNSKTKSVPINLTFPTYDITFDANGGKIGASDSDAKDQIVTSGIKYGAIIGKSPVHRAKAGYEFMGFYSVQNADANGKDATFNGTKYVDSETTVDSNGDRTYYAAWQSLPITATFVTQDGQLIGTVEGRYGNYLTAENMYNGDDGLNAAVKAAYTGSKIQFSGNTPIYKDGSTTYTFAGWKIIEAYDESVIDRNEDTVLKGNVTFQATYKKADATTYTIKFEDGAGNVTSTKDGYAYRTEITTVPVDDPAKATDERYSYEFIGWAKKLGSVNYFAVDANGKDKDGATVVYVSKNAPSFIVKGNDTYVPVFRMTEREYNVTFNYKVDGGTTESVTVGGYKYGDTVKMPAIKDNYTAGGYRYFITAWNVGTSFEDKQLEDITVEKDLELTASYGDKEAAKYVINFYGKDTDGKTDIWLNEVSNIYEHDSSVTAPEVPITIDTPDSLYTFEKWSPVVKTPASGDADYYATYTKKDYADVYFYNYDGTLLYKLDGKENTKFVGDKIPEYSNIIEGENVLPTKAEDEVGTYSFDGWKDSNGNTVVPGTDKFEGDTYLTAQFETVYKEYTVKFMNGGEVVSQKTYHYGEAIEKPADPTKEADETFRYTFKYWSPDVSDICYGDATYEAVYGRDYKYYTVTWLNDSKAALSSSNYKYGQKIQQYVVNTPVSYPPAETGKTWAFKHWVQCDANGNDILVDGKQVIFKRGQAMPAEALYFYPVFEQVDNVLTVTFQNEDGKEIGKAQVKYGEELAVYGDAFKSETYKSANDTHHFSFAGWVNANGGAAVTTVISDVTVKPSFTATPHTKDVYDITIQPTCTETGLADISCSDEACDKVFKNEVLEVIPDIDAPAGQVGLDGQFWASDANIDFNEIKYVNPKTSFLVNAWDFGTRSNHNPEGTLNRGVGKIEYYVSEEVVENPSDIGSWTVVYDYEAVAAEVLQNVLTENGKTMQDYIAMSTPNNAAKKAIDDQVKAILATYKANATDVLSNLDLEDGKNYIIYIRVSDREVNGVSNKCYFSTGKFSYGSEPAEITVSGDGFGTRFCEKAIIKVTDDNAGFKVYVDGEEVTVDETGKLEYAVVGSHTVTVVDSNGNNTTKNFEIKGGHTNKRYVVAATCEKAGSEYDVCTVCGHRAEVKVNPALGHKYTVNYIDKEAACEADGYRTFACDNNCGTKLIVKLNEEGSLVKWNDKGGEDGKGAWEALTAAESAAYQAKGEAADLSGLKATGHTYADEWVVDKAPTCSAEGAKHRDCEKCGILGRVTDTIEPDTENGHKYYREKVTTVPTCEAEGYKTKTCRYCGDVVTVETIPATGHAESEEYEILLAPTCEAEGKKQMKCANCDKLIGEVVVIAALGHAWIKDGDVVKEEITNDQGETVTVYKQNYKCNNSGCTETKVDILEDYVEPKEATITFINGGATHLTVTKSAGESIIATDVSKPSKAADATYEYIFSHWADADGKAVKFPIDVKDDATFTAVYTEKFINYTITYYEADGTTEYKKTGYLHNGEEEKLATAPKKAADWQYQYEFAGWKVINGDTVYTDKATINGANINLVATYNGVERWYAVTYMVGNETLETFAVKAGETAHDCFVTPTKNSDSKYHYEFKSWDKKAEVFTSVKSNIIAKAEFTPVLHAYVEEEIKAATCSAKAVHSFTCECGATYTLEVGSELEHDWRDPVYNEETGKNVITCDRCNESQTDTRKFTANFYVNDTDTSAIKNVSYIPWGTTIAGRLPADPTKESTSDKDFTFKGWALKDDAAKTLIDFTTYEIKEDCEFVAVFDEAVRKYNVVFRVDSTVIKTFYDVPAGSSVTLDLAADPAKAPDNNGHYIFKGWKGYEEGVRNITVVNVQGPVNVIASFTKEDHDYNYRTVEFGEATCQHGKGVRNYCECGWYEEKTGEPLKHDYVEVERVEATANKDGYILYQCANIVNGERCDATKKEELKYKDNRIVLSVQVLCNGVAKDNIKVEFIEKTPSAVAVPGTTGKDGYAKIMAEKSEAGYDCYVYIDGNWVEVTNFSADAAGNYSGTYSYTEAEADCSCACHRNNIWGTIFRFFHKIIKMITGEFKCCGNPDPMYG